MSKTEINEIDSLLVKANDFRLSKQERLKNTNVVYDLLNKREDSISIGYLFKIADRYYNIEEYDDFKRVSDKIYKLSSAKKDTVHIVKSLNNIADYYFYTLKNDSAYYYYTKLEKLYKDSGINEINPRVAHNKACILLYEKNYIQCEVNVIEILKEAIKKNDVRLVYDCYLILGMSSRGLKDYNTAINYYNKSLIQAEKLKDYPQYILLKAQPLNYIALVLQEQKKYKEALEYSQRALSLDDFEKSDVISYIYFTNTLAYSKFKTGDNSCLKTFVNCLKIGDSINNSHIQLTSKLHLSEYHAFKKDTLSALQYANSVLVDARQNKIFEDELKALELLAKIDPKNSTIYNERYITLSDSLQNVERATRNKFARIEFETDEITSEKKLIEAENRRISAQRRLILGFSLFLIIALVLLYIVKAQRTKNRELQYKQKQQQANFEIYQLMLDQHQKIEEGKQMEKQRISRELHDGVMGKLTAIRLNLFILNKKNDPETIARCMKQVDEIQNIEKEIRKIAHDLNQNLFADTSDFVLMVDNLVANIKEHSTVRFRVTADEAIDWTTVSSAVKIQVYRILQESLQNIGKYAKAENVSITMLKKDNAIVVSVTDDGVGFNTNQAKGGIGLKNMKERAAEIGATLKILSEKQQGTQIILTIPT
ncbi:tetratricopeptide repeat-containing sensor histidine kinase [Flavobacterium suncheonense]|uniref:histidine kinase n=1 Tax=Flavobacterium suncheonense GH29-5 = DSM 17707 TaxID=1121899 RepID=A0A0A2M948_9FLAO|nr:sensor histidine kinase [Flavobacterium suncheonense]KGO89157.1 hypothetical protein Q764_08780 [Flavobacterium suncheonense GH29-5 = DSM 17707]